MTRPFFVAANIAIALNVAFYPAAYLLAIWEPSLTHRINEMAALGAFTLLGLVAGTLLLAVVAPPPRAE